MINLEEFLDQYVDGYLLEDLKSMASINTGGVGSVGYPMLMTIVSGCELLGGLLTGKKKEAAFTAYWTDVLYPPRESRRAQMGEHIYIVARHGLAHLSLAKPGIGVSKGYPHLHLTRPDDDFCIDVALLHRDFRSSYLERARPKLLTDGAPGLKNLAEDFKSPRVVNAIEALRRLAPSGLGPISFDRGTAFVPNSMTVAPKY